jgi:hypothetical protein
VGGVCPWRSGYSHALSLQPGDVGLCHFPGDVSVAFDLTLQPPIENPLPLTLRHHEQCAPKSKSVPDAFKPTCLLLISLPSPSKMHP